MNIAEFIPQGANAGEKDHKYLFDPRVIAEVKYDGHRQTGWVMEDGTVFVKSASEATIDKEPAGYLVDNTERVPHIVAELATLPPGTLLDGEIVTSVTEKCDSNLVGSIFKCDPPKAIARQATTKMLKFVVFDLLFYAGVDFRDKPLEDRRAALEAIFEQNEENFRHLHLGEACKEADKTPFLTEKLALGHEGIMLKHLDSKYDRTRPLGKKGKARHSQWIKIKDKSTYDLVIMGFTWPEPISRKTDGTYSPNKFYERGQISGAVVGQYVPKDKYNEKAARETVNGYQDFEKTWAQVKQTIDNSEVTIDGKPYVLQPFGICGNFSDEKREHVTRNQDEYIGQVVEVKAYDRWPDTGAFRHPNILRYRDDKAAHQCTYDGEVQA